MYEQFYGFKERPFSLLPDPSFLVLTRQHSMAIALLEYGVLNPSAGFIVITGEVGAGKTTIVRHLLNQAGEDVTIGVITNTHSAFGDLLQWVLMAFGLGYQGKEKGERYEIFVKFLISEYAKGRRAVLVIDEAQNMAPETLEELRLLSNINADKDHVFQLILVGQPELRNVLRQPSLRQFAQRVSLSYHLDAMDRDETRNYVRHRIAAAGGDPEMMDDRSCTAIWHHSRGIPRVVNTLCDMALVYGYSMGRAVVDLEIIQNVVKDRIKGGMLDGPEPDGCAEEDERPANATST